MPTTRPRSTDLAPGPLYLALAAHLREAIARGDPSPGQALPTELALCAAHGVSRHTAREALRLLHEEGLIERRRGAGTIVAAPAPLPPFVQMLRGMDELLQYAREARLEIAAMAPAPASEGAALDLAPGQDWIRIEGMRGAPARPVAWTTVFVRADLCPARAEIEAWPGLLNQLIAERHGTQTSRVDQTIAAVLLGPEVAARLNADPGCPALQTTRRYFDRAGQMFQGSLSLHPGDRFVYDMRLERRMPKARRGR